VGDGVLIRFFADILASLVVRCIIFDGVPAAAVLGPEASFLVSVLAILATLARRSASLSAVCSLLLSFVFSLGALALAEVEPTES